MARRGATALLAAALLAGCASVPVAQPTAGSPATFAIAIGRGLPFALGVYGVGGKRDRSLFDDAAPDDADLVPERIGAGFIIDSSGLAVTAAHVVAGCDRVVVKLAGGRVVLAEKIGEDEDADIALLRLPMSLPAQPTFGNAAALRAGDWVLAVGEPYGLNRSVSAGIVGGKDRHFPDDRELLFIQSDLALNPGNSGGPLLDTSGAIVGMNLRTVVGTFGTAGVSLSIPIEVVLQIAQELKAGGSISRPRLGADYHDLTPPAALARGRTHAHGAVIELVRTGSLAERAGLRVGDIVVGMNGLPIGHGADFARALLAWRKAAGSRFTVHRGGGYRQLTLD